MIYFSGSARLVGLLLALVLVLLACSCGVDAFFGTATTERTAPSGPTPPVESRSLLLRRASLDSVAVVTKTVVQAKRTFLTYYKVVCLTKTEPESGSLPKANGGPGVEFLFTDFRDMHVRLVQDFPGHMRHINAPKQNDPSLTMWLNAVLFTIDNEEFQTDPDVQFFCNPQQLLWATLSVPNTRKCPYGYSRVVPWAEIDPADPRLPASEKLKKYTPLVDLVAPSGLDAIFTPKFLTAAAVSPPAYWVPTTQLVLRGDGRIPQEVFRTGFYPRYPQVDDPRDPLYPKVIDTVEQWVAAKRFQIAHSSSKWFVSSTVHPTVAAHFAKRNIGFVYLLMARDGVFISTRENDEKYETEAEVFLINGAPGFDVYAARQVLPGEFYVGPVYFNRKFQTSLDFDTLHAAVKDFFCLNPEEADTLFASNPIFVNL